MTRILFFLYFSILIFWKFVLKKILTPSLQEESVCSPVLIFQTGFRAQVVFARIKTQYVARICNTAHQLMCQSYLETVQLCILGYEMSFL